MLALLTRQERKPTERAVFQVKPPRPLQFFFTYMSTHANTCVNVFPAMFLLSDFR